MGRYWFKKISSFWWIWIVTNPVFASHPPASDFSASHLAVVQSSKEILGELCAQFKEHSTIDKETFFDPSIATPSNFRMWKRIFETLYRVHGVCQNTEIVTRSRLDPQSLQVVFNLSDHTRWVFDFVTHSVGKLSKFVIKGSLPLENSMVVEQSSVKLRDGTHLATYVFMPPSKEPRPVVLDRTNYLYVNEQFDLVVFYNTAKYFVDRGYNFVLQGVRGSAGSEGEFKIFNPQEVDDSRDALNWISQQVFCNGKIAAAGTSYEGFTALAVAETNHPSLRVVFAGGSPASLGDDAFRVHGLLLPQILSYLRYNHFKSGPKGLESLPNLLLEKAALEPDLTKYDHLVFGQTIPEWKEIASHINDPDAEIWKRSIKEGLADVNIPLYHIAGTGQDADNQDVISNFKLIESKARFRSMHHLIVGPWNHAESTPYSVGLGSSTLSPFMAKRFDSLLDYYMKGIPSVYVNESRVQLVTSSGTTAVGSTQYPPPGLKTETLFFHSSGTLSADVPDLKESSSSSYLYLPTQLENQDGRQVLAFQYQSQTAQEIIGEYKAHLYVRSDRPVTDIFLFVVRTDRLDNVLSFSDCLMGGKVYMANAVRLVESDNCPISVKLDAGDTLSFYLTSNAFPSFFRVAETLPSGKVIFQNGKVDLMHSVAYPSFVSWNIQ